MTDGVLVNLLLGVGHETAPQIFQVATNVPDVDHNARYARVCDDENVAQFGQEDVLNSQFHAAWQRRRAWRPAGVARASASDKFKGQYE